MQAKKILVVDDHKTNCMLMSALLKKLDLSHDIAEDGFSGLSLFDKNFYTLVLMDIFMPHKDGFECLKYCKFHQDSVKAKIPIVAVTACPDLDGLELFDGIIPKPINIRIFNDMVLSFI